MIINPSNSVIRTYTLDDEIEKMGFAAGSMGPKVQAAVNFARNTGKDAVIGSLSDIVDIVKGKAGTRITNNAKAISYYS